MLRLQNPRYLAALLWLLVALMPVRVMALGWMQATPPVQATAAAHELAAADQPLPACHAMAAEPAADEDHSVRSACAACELCHSVVVPVAALVFTAMRLHGDPPQETSRAPHARPAPDGPFRPPR